MSTATTPGPGAHGGSHGAQDNSLGMEQGSSEENRRVLEWIAQLMNVNTRETALLELSKKREQVPELALILWHSYGKALEEILLGCTGWMLIRAKAS